MRAFALGLIFSAAAFPCLAQTILKSEPLMLAPYEVAFVQDSSCGAGKVRKVTGAIRGCNGARPVSPWPRNRHRWSRRPRRTDFRLGFVLGERGSTSRDVVCPGPADPPGRLVPTTPTAIPLRFALGVRLVSGGVFVRLELARPDLVILVEYRTGRRRCLARRRHRPRDRFSGRSSRHRRRLGRPCSAWHRSRTVRRASSAPVKTVNAEAEVRFQAWLPCRHSTARFGNKLAHFGPFSWCL